VSTVSEDAALTWLSFSLGCIPMQPYIDLQQQPLRPRPRDAAAA
jgi:hypothetical protein